MLTPSDRERKEHMKMLKESMNLSVLGEQLQSPKMPEDTAGKVKLATGLTGVASGSVALGGLGAEKAIENKLFSLVPRMKRALANPRLSAPMRAKLQTSIMKIEKIHKMGGKIGNIGAIILHCTTLLLAAEYMINRPSDPQQNPPQNS